MYVGSLAYLTHFETGGKYNRRKIHKYGHFGGGIEDLFLFVILRISKNVIIFRAKKLWRSLPTGKLMFSAKFFKPLLAVKI